VWWQASQTLQRRGRDLQRIRFLPHGFALELERIKQFGQLGKQLQRIKLKQL
jgi:hypothetical protein